MHRCRLSHLFSIRSECSFRCLNAGPRCGAGIHILVGCCPNVLACWSCHLKPLSPFYPCPTCLWLSGLVLQAANSPIAAVKGRRVGNSASMIPGSSSPTSLGAGTPWSCCSQRFVYNTKHIRSLKANAAVWITMHNMPR